MTRSLDFYLALGFEVAATADGWALPRMDTTQFVLVHRSAGRTVDEPVLRVCATDPVVLSRRLNDVGATVSPRTRSARAPDGQFATTDPDGNVVLVSTRSPAGGGSSVPTATTAASARVPVGA